MLLETNYRSGTEGSNYCLNVIFTIPQCPKGLGISLSYMEIRFYKCEERELDILAMAPERGGRLVYKTDLL